MNVRQTRRFVTLVFLVVVALLGLGIYRLCAGPSVKPAAQAGGKPAPSPRPARAPSAPGYVHSAGGTNAHQEPARTDTQPATTTAATDRPQTQSAPGVAIRTPTTQDRARAPEMLALGLRQINDGQLLPARASLSEALWSGGLNDQQAEAVRKHLADLADKMLFSRQLFPDDPCQLSYVVQTGDALAVVERRLKLHVPAQLIMKINGLPNAASLRAGQGIKLIRGPFHAIVNKSRFTMDVYLQDDNGRMLFVRRFPVGTGKNGSTPPGRWRVTLGGKITNAAWTPPSSSDLPRKKVLPGDPDYALGKRGFWISLEGIDGNPYTSEDGYGIHDTNDQNSVGRSSSMGCIRMKDDDIDQVFSMLYEYWSTVTVTD